MSLRPATVLALAAVLGVSATAGAAPPWLELRWPHVIGCPTGAEVEAAVVRLIDGGTPQPVAAEAKITADARGYTLELVLQDAGGTQRRVLENPRCEPLADATAVILAVAAEPLAVAAQVEPLALAPAVAAPSPLGDDALELSPAPGPSRPRERPALALSFGPAAGVGPARRLAAGVAFGLAVLWPRARLDVRGSYWFPSPLRFPGYTGSGADLSLAAGAVRGCPRRVQRTIALQICGGIELGVLQAQGVGLARTERARGLWAAGLLAPGVQWRPLRRLALGVEGEALVAFTRRTYAARGAPELLYTVPPIGLRVSASLAVIF